MEEKQDQGGGETRHGGGVFRWVWITGVCLVFYVLSPGPVNLLAKHRVVRLSTVALVYRPLTLVCERSLAIKHFYGWYTRLWVGGGGSTVDP